MNPARLQHLVAFERVTYSLTASGAKSEVWTEFARARAELVEQNTEESAEKDRGSVSTTSLTFKARWTAGVTLADRVQFGGKAFDIVALAEVGRREALEIRLRRTGL